MTAQLTRNQLVMLRMRALRREKRRRGICLDCHRKRAADAARCALHLKVQREYIARKRGS